MSRRERHQALQGGGRPMICTPGLATWRTGSPPKGMMRPPVDSLKWWLLVRQGMRF